MMSRNCTHRWMEVCSGAGEAGVLQCPYHLWSFGLDGHLAGAPEMKQSAGFDRKDWGLKQFRHEVWKGFVFVNFDGQAAPVAEQLAGLAPMVDPYDFENYQIVEHTDWGGSATGTGRSWWTTSWSATTIWARIAAPWRTSSPPNSAEQVRAAPYFTTMWSRQADGYPAEEPFLRPAPTP